MVSAFGLHFHRLKQAAASVGQRANGFLDSMAQPLSVQNRLNQLHERLRSRKRPSSLSPDSYWGHDALMEEVEAYMEQGNITEEILVRLEVRADNL